MKCLSCSYQQFPIALVIHLKISLQIGPLKLREVEIPVQPRSLTSLDLNTESLPQLSLDLVIVIGRMNRSTGEEWLKETLNTSLKRWWASTNPRACILLPWVTFLVPGKRSSTWLKSINWWIRIFFLTPKSKCKNLSSVSISTCLYPVSRRSTGL